MFRYRGLEVDLQRHINIDDMRLAVLFSGKDTLFSLEPIPTAGGDHIEDDMGELLDIPRRTLLRLKKGATLLLSERCAFDVVGRPSAANLPKEEAEVDE